MPRKKEPQQTREFHVSVSGNDLWSGTRARPDARRKDGPFATLDRARDAIRDLKKAGGLPPGGVTVWIGEGDYVLRSSFRLTAENSGEEGAPVVYRARVGEMVRLLGGPPLTGFSRVTDPAVLARFDAAAREHVVQADLKSCGVWECGTLRPRGFGRQGVPSHLELFFGGQPMTVARWPNDGFVTIAGAKGEGDMDDGHGHKMRSLESGFHYEGDRPRQWKSLKNIWVHGYWAWDWANSFEAIDTIDLDQRHIRTKPPHGCYGFRVGQRFYFLNVLEELDSPGEYYVDTEKGILYFWPPAPMDGVECLASVLETPLVVLDNASHVTLQDLTLEASRGFGIQMTGGRGNRVAGCTLRNLGNDAVVIDGGTEHGIVGCDLYQLADGGIRLTGGDRKTLTPCGHFVRNNHIHHFARWSRCYVPAVLFSGVGFHVAHNLIHDTPHTAILYLANESVIEFNEIHHVTLETGDCGSIYTGRDYTARGNVIRHNYIHDTGGFGMGSMAVYLDDCVSGQTIYGNVFVRTTRAAFVGGGRDVRVENNIFVDCTPAVHVDGRGLSKSPVWHDMIYKTMKGSLDAMEHHEPPYSERYPELRELDAFYTKDDGVPPGNILVDRNICVGGRWSDIVWGAKPEHVTFGTNLVGTDPLFADMAKGDFGLKADSPAWGIGFDALPLDRIGLVQDEYRRR